MRIVPKVDLSNYLRRKRLDLGMTQQELGDHLGYSSQFVTNWEKGRSSPPGHVLPKLIKALKIKEAEFLDILTQLSVDYWTTMLHPKSKKR